MSQLARQIAADHARYNIRCNPQSIVDLAAVERL